MRTVGAGPRPCRARARHPVIRSLAMTIVDRSALERAAQRAAQAAHGLDDGARRHFAEELLAPIASRVLGARAGGARVIGVYGAQGSGKSTLASALVTVLREHAGLRVAALSLDDFYLTRAHRLRVAARLHPLFETRGAPGTHDIPLLLRTLDGLLDDGPGAAPTVPVPRFDKARDDRSPAPEAVHAPVDLVVLEGWCLGVPPEPKERLETPCNPLEAERDPDGRFRRCVNYRLAHDYAELAQRVDWLLALLVESFDVSSRHRLEQEHTLRARTAGGMTDDEVAAFMQRFERVSRWALSTMNDRADLAVDLDAARRPRVPLSWT